MNNKVMLPAIRCIVAGSRSCWDYGFVESKLAFYFKNSNTDNIEIVSGTAKGADKLGERFPADWNKHMISIANRYNVITRIVIFPNAHFKYKIPLLAPLS